MLTQIVRPMVRTQIRLLANSQATYATLVKTISQWLGFLGVQASVTQLQANSQQIQLSLTVGRPDSCDEADWQKILDNLNQTNAEHPVQALTPQQERKLQRLLAYMIQVGNPNGVNWDILSPQLQTLAFTEETLGGVRARAESAAVARTAHRRTRPRYCRRGAVKGSRDCPAGSGGERGRGSGAVGAARDDEAWQLGWAGLPDFSHLQRKARRRKC